MTVGVDSGCSGDGDCNVGVVEMVVVVVGEVMVLSDLPAMHTH